MIFPPFRLRKTGQEKHWCNFVERMLTNHKSLMFLIRGQRVIPRLSDKEREENKKNIWKLRNKLNSTKGISVQETEGASKKEERTANFRRIKQLIRNARMCKHAAAAWLIKRKNPWI